MGSEDRYEPLIVTHRIFCLLDWMVDLTDLLDPLSAKSPKAQFSANVWLWHLPLLDHHHVSSTLRRSSVARVHLPSLSTSTAVPCVSEPSTDRWCWKNTPKMKHIFRYNGVPWVYSPMQYIFRKLPSKWCQVLLFWGICSQMGIIIIIIVVVINLLAQKHDKAQKHTLQK